MLIVFVYIAIGMSWYARIQKFCFWGGMLGLVLVALLLLFRQQLPPLSPISTRWRRGSAHRAVMCMPPTLAAGEAAGTVAGPLLPLALGASIFLVPMLTFFNLWPNWGSTLYGEVRGASDYKRNFWGMAAAVIVTTVGALILFVV